jgi:hypothetical protein
VTNQIYRWGLGFRDARGQVGRVDGWVLVPTGGTISEGQAIASAVGAAVAACSNGAVVSATGIIGNPSGSTQVINPDQYGTNQAYPNAEDKAVLTFLMANQTLSRLSIPAPVGTGGSNLFEPDGETIKALATPMVNLVAALTAVGTHGEAACTKNGSTYNIFVAGMRARRRFQRKVTLWTLDPTETIPEE